MLNGTIQLEILNWEKFNPRKDVKAVTWLRFQNSLFENPDFFEFDHSEICFWLYLLSIASRKQSAVISVNISHAVKIGRFQKEIIQSAIVKLEQLQCVRVFTDDIETHVRKKHATDVRTDVRTEDCSEQTPVVFTAEYPQELSEIKQELLERKVKPKAIETILKAYPEPQWVISEFRKMFIWEDMNPRKKKKNFGPFAARWLAKGWDQRKLSGSSNGMPSKMRMVTVDA